MKKFIKCKDNKGDEITLVFDKKGFKRAQRYSTSVRLVTKEELFDAFLVSCGLQRDVRWDEENDEVAEAEAKKRGMVTLNQFLKSVNYKREFEDTSIICTDKKGRKWAVCLDVDTANFHASLYMSQKFIETMDKEDDLDKGVYMATTEGVYFVGNSIYAFPEDQLMAYLEVNELEEVG